MNVTLYKETYVSPRPVKLSTVIDLMRNVNKAKAVTSYRKELKNRIPGSKFPEVKLPPFIMFSEFHKANGKFILKQYSGIVLLEINDLADQQEVDYIRMKASESPQTLAAFTGLSGLTVKILIRFSLPDGNLPQHAENIHYFHAHAYRQAINYYRLQLNHKITPTPPSPEQQCRLSYDPQLYFNPDALVITMEQPFDLPQDKNWIDTKKRHDDPLERLIPGMERNRRISLLYETSLYETLTYFQGFPDQEPKHFLIRLAENCFNSGIPEEDAVKWIKFHSDLEAYEMEFRTTIRNVYLLNKRFGQKPCLNSAQLLSLQLEDFMQRRYEFRRNTIKHEVEYRKRNSYSFDFRPITDEALNTFSMEAHAEGLNFWDRDIKRYVNSERVADHNPVSFYLDNLPKWDGIDYIRALANTIPTNNIHWADHFYRWFIGMVAQWKQMSKTYANSVVPLLIGDQGCGKSTWCKKLIPESLQEYYTDGIDFSSKREVEMALHRFILINLDEFDSIGISYQPYLKHLLQKPDIKMRRPYKSSIQSMKRYGVFIATSNNRDMLTDPTGSRRFLCTEIKGIIKEDPTIDINQVYAQALAAIHFGERYWFDKEEEKIIISDNRFFQQMPVEEQLLLQHFSSSDEFEEEGEWLLAIEIINRLQKAGKTKFSHIHTRHFGRILRKHHIPVKHTIRGNLYHVIENEIK